MSITPLSDDLNVISGLADTPNDTSGLTASQLKARFDLAGNTIKDYLNNTMAPNIEADITAAVAAAQIQGGNMPSGGTTGQFIRKNSNGDYDYSWQTLTGDSNPTAGTMMQRDASGRAQVADPSCDADIENKGHVASAISSAITAALASYARIATGTYTGTNTTAPSLTLPFAPKLVLIKPTNNHAQFTIFYYGIAYIACYSDQSGGSFANVTWNGSTVSWSASNTGWGGSGSWSPDTYGARGVLK